MSLPVIVPLDATVKCLNGKKYIYPKVKRLKGKSVHNEGKFAAISRANRAHLQMCDICRKRMLLCIT